MSKSKKQSASKGNITNQIAKGASYVEVLVILVILVIYFGLVVPHGGKPWSWLPGWVPWIDPFPLIPNPALRGWIRPAGVIGASLAAL